MGGPLKWCPMFDVKWCHRSDDLEIELEGKILSAPQELKEEKYIYSGS